MKQRSAKSPTLTQTEGRNAPRRRNGHRGGQRERHEQEAAVSIDPPPKEEVSGHIDESSEPERKPGRRDRQIVGLDEERAHVDERARPPREREELAGRPACDAGVRQHRAEPGAYRRGRSGALPKEKRGRYHGHRRRNDEPGQPPADLAEDPDERHPDDPRERRPEQREGQHARSVRRGRPLGGGGDRGRVRHADPHADERLRDDEHREVRCRTAHERGDRERDERAEHQTAQSHTRRQQPRRERGGTGGETGHRP